MKLKYYLRGLGVGILFSTIILSFSFKAALKEKTKEIKSNTDNSVAANTDEEIKNLEDLLIPTTDPTNESATDDTTMPTDTPEATPSEDSSDPILEVDKAEDSNKSNEDKKLVAEETDKKVDSNEENNDSQDYVYISIQNGMSSGEVALILKNYGIIENNKDFNNFLIENGYYANIKVGDFKLSKNSTYEQIANLIVIK